LIALFAIACSKNGTAAAPVTAVSPLLSPSPANTPTPLPPTAVPPTATPTEPMAALVNGQPIFLSVYERELSRYKQAQAALDAAQAENAAYPAVVLNALIERTLIAQAAAKQGITIAPDKVDAKLAEMEASVGDTADFAAWLTANQWSRDEFRTALASEMLTEAMVAAVTAEVPTAVEQVHARYLQVSDPDLAESLRQQVLDGSDFAALAEQYSLDRVTAVNGGDLGYFARGSLLVTAVEEAAFALQPGETSAVITAVNDDGSSTYYLLQVIEQDGQRPLSADMRYTMLQQTFETWLDKVRQNADITRFVDT